MINPFLKWAGGKRWLVNRYKQLFPSRFERYIEPFLGSGAVFFYLCPNQSILSDKNGELINTYRIIKKYPDEINTLLKKYQNHHNPTFYYKLRKTEPACNIKRAARFIYLNRVCFNGLYRVNLQGKFNVPIGSKTEVKYPKDYLLKIASYLQRASLLESDFEIIINKANKNDFLFVDPPYTVTHNNNGFIKYNDILFSWEDQIRLSLAVRRAVKRGVLVFVSNANHLAVKELYSSFLSPHILYRTSILSAKSINRRLTSEVAMLSY